MRIGVFQSSCPTPSEIFVYNQVAELRRRGHEVRLFGYRNKDATSELREWYRREVGVPMIHPWRVPPLKWLKRMLLEVQGWGLPSKGKMLAATRNQEKFGWWAETLHLNFWACAMLRQQIFDVIHAHFAPIGGRVAMLKECGVIDCPLVVSLHGADVTSTESEAHIGSGLYPWVWKHADLYTYNSSFIRDRAVKMGFPQEKMRHLPVSIGRLFEQEPERSPREGQEVFRVLSVGRMVPKKGQLTGLRAFKKFLSICPQASYTIVGDGPLRPEIEAFIREQQLQQQVRLTGALTQKLVRELMCESDVFVFPSETAPNGDMEGQGLVVQEAQACELPVIITRHNGVPDGILPDKTGFICEEKDFQAMARYLQKIYRYPELGVEMGLAGREFVMGNYTAETLTMKLEQILMDATERGT